MYWYICPAIRRSLLKIANTHQWLNYWFDTGGIGVRVYGSLSAAASVLSGFGGYLYFGAVCGLGDDSGGDAVGFSWWSGASYSLLWQIAANLRLILYGVLLEVMMHVRPQGIAGDYRVDRGRLTRRECGMA
jgi:hypothetical protein